MQGPSAEVEEDGSIAEINIIPLVDVVLVLLIIFMVTTVFLREAKLDLKLPPGAPASSVQKGPAEINVVVAKGGAITVNGSTATIDNLGAKILAISSKNSRAVVILRGSEQAEYSKIVPVLDEIGRTKVPLTLALVAAPKPK